MYLHDWSETGLEGMKSDFGISDADLQGVNILLASYTYEDYSGDAFVLFEKDGKLFEVNGSHCSCYGLESCGIGRDETTQWQPEETTKEALIHRLTDGYLGRNEFADELRQVLDQL
jgi:hypothetical protein